MVDFRMLNNILLISLVIVASELLLLMFSAYNVIFEGLIVQVLG